MSSLQERTLPMLKCDKLRDRLVFIKLPMKEKVRKLR